MAERPTDSRPCRAAWVGPAVLLALVGAGWIGVAVWGVPALLDAAYHGRSGLAPLDRWVQGRFHRGLGHYQALWRDFAVAVSLALGIFAGLVGMVGRRAVVPAGAFLGLTVLSGPRQDYVAYLDIWRGVLGGDDPWRVSPEFGYALNAYGPLFDVLAPLVLVGSLAPKLGFATAHLAVVLAARPPIHPGVWRALVLGPFFWIEIAYFGHFDILMGLLCVLAVAARMRGRDGLAGLSLGLGVLLKFLPVALVPLVATEGRRVRWRVLGVAAGVVAAGMGLAWWVWGPAVVRPLGFAQGRGSTFASLFRFLRGAYSPVRALGGPVSLDRLSTPMLAAAGLLTWGISLAWRLRADASATLAALVVVAFYQVGFLQYQMVPVLLVLAWIHRHPERWAGDGFLRWAVGSYLGWITVLDALLCVGGGVIHPGDPLGWLDEVAGLPTFLVVGWVWVAVLRASRPAVLPTPAGPVSVE